MKKLIYLFMLLAFVACNTAPKEKENTKVQAPATVAEATVNIGGMHCEMCVASIEKGVNELAGIKEVNVSLSDSTAHVKYNTAEVALADIEKAIEKRGYKIKAASK